VNNELEWMFIVYCEVLSGHLLGETGRPQQTCQCIRSANHCTALIALCLIHEFVSRKNTRMCNVCLAGMDWVNLA
jgi:hypothetical protein